MATSNSKKRLFEVMGKVDNTFKPKLNEISSDMAWRAHDAAVKKEIDTFNSPYHSEEEHEKAKGQAEKFRYYGMGKDYDSSEQPMDESKFGVNRKYTHFALLKDSNKIINGWEYKGYDQSELNQFKRDYFFNDIKDMDIEPKNVKIITGKKLISMGINPFDWSSWWTNEERSNYFSQ